MNKWGCFFLLNRGEKKCILPENFSGGYDKAMIDRRKEDGFYGKYSGDDYVDLFRLLMADQF